LRIEPYVDSGKARALQQVADAMLELGGWFKNEFWNGAGSDGRINTKLITKKLESYLPADPDGVRAELADLGVSVAGHELPLRASLEPRGVVL
jgi:hypothetical protein